MHKLKLHQWASGILKVTELKFSSLKDAFSYLKICPTQSAKIFNNDGEIVYHHNEHQDKKTYA